jgi:hypothetical protein
MRAKARQLGWAQRGALLEALFWLGLARLALLIVPFRRIAPWLGTQMAQTEERTAPREEALAQEIGWAVGAVARRTPWESACLAQAISAKAMLRRRGVASTLYLGLARGEGGQLQAHAWLRCGAAVVTGGDHSDYTVMASFDG